MEEGGHISQLEVIFSYFYTRHHSFWQFPTWVKKLKKTTSYHAKVTLATLTPTGRPILQTSTLLTASMSARLTQHLEHFDVDVSDSAMVILSAIMMTMIW